MRKPGFVSFSGKSQRPPRPSLFDAAANVKIRLFSQHDLNDILKVQNACKGIAVWQPHDYEQLARDPRGMLLVAERNDRMLPEIAGFSAFYRIEKEAELWNIAVAPAHRRRGIGRALLQEALQKLSVAGTRRIFLEVRESNLPALELYYSLGFNRLARRKDYYYNPKEDALVFVLKLSPP